MDIDPEWLRNVIIAGLLVVGMLLVLLFTAMTLREAEEASLRGRAPRVRLERSDPQQAAAAAAPRRADRKAAPEKPSARGGGVIISGFDTGGARLLVSVGAGAIKKRRTGVSFGRDPTISEVTIPDDGGSLSRRHFRIRARDGGLEIEDLGSVAGTKLEGVQLKPFEPRPLTLPAKLELGRTVLDIRGGGEGDVANDVQTLLIGRHSDCDVVASDESVSRFHAELVLGRNRRYFLVDRQSTRGTWVSRGGWQRLDRAEYVQQDERVRFGDSEFTVEDLARRAQRRG